MIAFADAFATVLDQIRPGERVAVPLAASLDTYLGSPVTAPCAIPRFTNSAMDGFGVRLLDVAQASVDHPVRLPLQGTIRAGDAPAAALPPGTAVKVLTGAPIPRGVEAVVMKENVEERDGEVLLRRPPRPGENIRLAGEEYQPGDLVLGAGTRITPPAMGLLASLGHASVMVHRRPALALLVTGDELRLPGMPLAAGQIYAANTPMLAAALRLLGLRDIMISAVPDNLEAMTTHLRTALQTADAVLTVGGVSVGDFDFVKAACAALGIATHVWQVAIKPGKPFYFGTYPRTDGYATPVFGLPGNPVGALVTYQVLVKPALRKLLGAVEVAPRTCRATLRTALKKKPGRLEFLRGVASSCADELMVTPATGQDSHMLGGMTQANCLIYFPREAEYLPAAEQVTIEWLDW